MARSLIILLLIIAISLIVFKAFDKNVGAEDTDTLGQILANQKIIIEKLDVINGKLDVLKMRIRQ